MPRGVAHSKKDVAKLIDGLRSRPHEVQRLVDKNSRTLVKVAQLMEYTHRPGADLVDKDGLVTRYVEKLKARMTRRLVKLSKWSDLSYEERLPKMKKSDPRHLINGGTYLPPLPSQYVNPVVYNPTPIVHLSESGPSSADGSGPGREYRDLTKPQPCVVKPSDLPSFEELLKQPPPVQSLDGVNRVPFRFIPNGVPLRGWGEVIWKDYSEMQNINTYCAVYHEGEFHVGPITESHGAVVRIGSGDKGRISLNKIIFRSAPFEKPDSWVEADGTVVSAKESCERRVRELYDQLTKRGWPPSHNRAAVPPLEIPEDTLKSFRGMVFGHPECTRASISLRG